MDEQEYPFWITIGATEILKFSDLAHLIAKAQHPSVDESLEYVAARINLNKELPDSVHRGALVVRNASGLGVHTFPHGQALNDAVVLPQDLTPFLNARGIGLRRTKQTSPERVVIADLANALSREQADAFPGWAKDDADNDLRRDIAAAMNVHGLGSSRVPGILPHIVRMATQGLISPKSAFNGMPALNLAEDIDCTWFLSPADADEVRRALVSEANMRARQVETEDERKNAWQEFMAPDEEQVNPEYQLKLARAHELHAELATWKAMKHQDDPYKYEKILAKIAQINGELDTLNATSQPNETTLSATREAPILRQQETAIISWLHENGHDPRNLPDVKNGSRTAKAYARTALNGKGLFSGSTTFEKAWERLRAFQEICESKSTSKS